MENQVTEEVIKRQFVYKDDQFLIYKNTVIDTYDIYEQKIDMFHNTYCEHLRTIKSPDKNQYIVDSLFYNLLKKEEKNGKSN